MLGDVSYTLGAYAFLALVKRNLLWLKDWDWTGYASLAILGAFIGLFVEYKALALHRWAYTSDMPLVFGVGLSPLLQMMILLPLSVAITAYIMRDVRGSTY